jgi:glutaredoxin
MGVELIEYDIDRDKAREEEMEKLGGRGLPFVVIYGEQVWGFQPNAMVEALERKNRGI